MFNYSDLYMQVGFVSESGIPIINTVSTGESALFPQGVPLSILTFHYRGSGSKRCCSFELTGRYETGNLQILLVDLW